MEIKKIFILSLLVFCLFLISEKTLAQSSSSSSSSEYTAEQKTCIVNKQREILKPAQEIFDDATKLALEAKKNALKDIEKIKDAKKKAEAIKIANDKYNKDNSVIKARVPYMQAFSSARTLAISQCVVNNSGGNFLWQKVKDLFKKFGSSLRDAFTFI